MLSRSQVTLGILAGGQASRLGYVDKARAIHRGETLLARTLRSLGPGFARTLLSYNRPADEALATGAVEIIPDRRPGSLGPLAGIDALLHAATTEWLLTVPVDLQTLPGELPERLLAMAVQGSSSGLAVADTDGLQPLVALWPVTSAAQVSRALDAGESAVHSLLGKMGFQIVDISPQQLGNLNFSSDLE